MLITNIYMGHGEWQGCNLREMRNECMVHINIRYSGLLQYLVVQKTFGLLYFSLQFFSLFKESSIVLRTVVSLSFNLVIY